MNTKFTAMILVLMSMTFIPASFGHEEEEALFCQKSDQRELKRKSTVPQVDQ